jgi:hypothetical protein
MSQSAYPARSTRPQAVTVPVRFQGNGSSAPVQELGEGVSVARAAEGVYEYTFGESPGLFVGVSDALQATTAADVKGHTLVWGAWNASTLKIRVSLFNASDAAHDLATAEWIHAQFLFSRTSVSG